MSGFSFKILNKIYYKIKDQDFGYKNKIAIFRVV